MKLPNPDDREALLKSKLQDVEDLDRLVTETEGYTSAEVRTPCLKRFNLLKFYIIQNITCMYINY